VNFVHVSCSSVIARKFHELNQAYELLLDPLRRLALDAKLRLKEARAERYKSYDNKRKNMVEELEARERAFKKSRVDKQKEETERWQETERIKEEGRRLREDKERDVRQREEEQLQMAEEAKEDELEAPSLGMFIGVGCVSLTTIQSV
jgi:DnaJ family protein C protein 17